jgi:energy-coupling factor transporter ATP-binding protein EcfA2/predicted MPP superfamily phosphohydrolase
MSGQEHRWPNIREAFFTDLEKQLEKSGTPDIVLFTGDLVQRGAPDEFKKLNELLGTLWERLSELGSHPILLPIPGNHDLVRPSEKSPTVRLLAKWADNPEIHEEFWDDADSEYRKLIEGAFANYTEWRDQAPFLYGLKIQHGLLPGDFSVTLEKDGMRIGIVGLNTTFLQLTGGNYEGRLAWSAKQFHKACGGDGTKWVSQHNACLLLTHQPPRWLDKHSLEEEYAEIAPAGRFAIHLFGHMHQNLIHSKSAGGGEDRHLWQGCSLFGLEEYGEGSEKKSRSHGYAAGTIELENGSGFIRMWPRVARRDEENGWRIVADNERFVLEEDGGTKRREVKVNTPKAARGTKLQINDLARLLKSAPSEQAAGGFRQTPGGGWPYPYEDPSLRSYCDALMENHGYIRFVEIPFLKDVSDVEIENLYVTPQFSAQEIHADTSPDTWPERFDAIDALQKHQRLVLLGDPGSGKSTLISSLAWQLSRPKPYQPNRWAQAFGGLIPLPMILRELKLKADITWEGLLEAFLEHRVGKLLQTRERVELLLKSGRAFVLLDGLDELGNIAVRRKLREAVHTGMSEYQDAHWVLTSRVVGYEQVPFHLGGDILEADESSLTDEQQSALRVISPVADLLYLSPFTDEQIAEFSHNWYTQHEKDRSLIKEREEDLVNAIKDNEGTQRLARIPYLLTLMALIHHKNAKLPHGRTELYGRIAAAYLESIDFRRALDQLPYSLEQKKRWLAEVAYRMQLRRTSDSMYELGQREILASAEEVHEWLTKAMSESGAEHAEREAATLLDYFARRSGLLLPRGEGQFAFMHLSLQEYFAACYLEPRLTASRFSPVQKNVEPTDEELHAWANNSNWVETFILLFELLAAKPRQESESLLEHLFGDRFENDESMSQSTAVQLLAEISIDHYVTISAETRKRMRQRCWRWVFGLRFLPEFDERSLLDSEFRQRNLTMLIFSYTPAVRTLLLEYEGDLTKAWRAAGISAAELKSNVRALNLAGCINLIDLKPLTVLSNLRGLDITGCTSVTNLEPLAEITNLQVLSLSNRADTGYLKPLSRLNNLMMLGLYNFDAADDADDEVDLNPLRELRNLVELHIHGFRSVDLTPLCDMPKLKIVCSGQSEKVVVPVKLQRQLLKDDPFTRRLIAQSKRRTKQSRKGKAAKPRKRKS